MPRVVLRGLERDRVDERIFQTARHGLPAGDQAQAGRGAAHLALPVARTLCGNRQGLDGAVLHAPRRRAVRSAGGVRRGRAARDMPHVPAQRARRKRVENVLRQQLRSGSGNAGAHDRTARLFRRGFGRRAGDRRGRADQGGRAERVHTAHAGQAPADIREAGKHRAEAGRGSVGKGQRRAGPRCAAHGGGLLYGQRVRRRAVRVRATALCRRGRGGSIRTRRRSADAQISRELRGRRKPHSQPHILYRLPLFGQTGKRAGGRRVPRRGMRFPALGAGGAAGLGGLRRDRCDRFPVPTHRAFGFRPQRARTARARRIHHAGRHKRAYAPVPRKQGEKIWNISRRKARK